MRPRVLIAAAAAVATLAAAPAAQAVDQPTLDRINDSMAATYGARLPIVYVDLPPEADAMAWLRQEDDHYVIELDTTYATDSVAETCQTVAHEYTHYARLAYENDAIRKLGDAPAEGDPGFEAWNAAMVAAVHSNWPQDESQPYPPCRDFRAGEQWRRQTEDRAWTLQVWLNRAKPLSWRNCRTRRTPWARLACVRKVDAKWRHRRQVRAELARIDRLLGTPTL